MIKNSKNINSNEDKLYNKVLDLSRNKLFYTKLNLKDTFENRINLIFLHISFLFNKIKDANEIWRVTEPPKSSVFQNQCKKLACHR